MEITKWECSQQFELIKLKTFSATNRSLDRQSKNESLIAQHNPSGRYDLSATCTDRAASVKDIALKAVKDMGDQFGLMVNKVHAESELNSNNDPTVKSEAVFKFNRYFNGGKDKYGNYMKSHVVSDTNGNSWRPKANIDKSNSEHHVTIELPNAN